MLVMLMMLGGCFGGGAKIAANAVDDGARAFGVGVSTIEASADDVTRLADQATVEDDVIRDVARQLDSQATWNRSVRGVSSAQRTVPDEVGDVATGVACDVIAGEITTEEQLRDAIVTQVGGLTQDEFSSLVQGIEEMWRALLDAQQSDDPQLRAAAVLTCFTFENLS